jgi:hypothetical protein
LGNLEARWLEPSWCWLGPSEAMEATTSPEVVKNEHFS